MNGESRRIAILGGGLAGLAAAVALSRAGCKVTLLEKRPDLGGRAGSLRSSDSDECFDNCQHVLMPCFTNLLDFYRAIGVVDKIRFHRKVHFLVPPGRPSTLRAGALPAPLHCAVSFFRLRHLGSGDKLRIARCLLGLAFRRQFPLDASTAAAWLESHGQSRAAIEGFWHPVMVSALNGELEKVSAAAAAMVFRLAFLSSRKGWWLGIPTVPLRSLYGSRIEHALEKAEGRVRLRTEVRELEMDGGSISAAVLASGERVEADRYVIAVPWTLAGALLGPGGAARAGLPPFAELESSPITCLHLWFDRPVTDLPFAALPGSPIHWFFNKAKNYGMGAAAGGYLQLVTSASRTWLGLTKRELLEIALAELGQVLPGLRGAVLLRSRVIKEPHATFCPSPGSESLRPESRCGVPNLYLAGDWTRTGWPATMEGAVRSGYAAAEALLADEGRAQRLLANDIRPDGLMRLLGRLS